MNIVRPSPGDYSDYEWVVNRMTECKNDYLRNVNKTHGIFPFICTKCSIQDMKYMINVLSKYPFIPASSGIVDTLRQRLSKTVNSRNGYSG